MRYEHVRTLPEAKFKCLTGVRHATFEAMHEALEAARAAKAKPSRVE